MTSDRVSVVNNHVGVDATGRRPLPNDVGIRAEFASDVTIGGESVSANVVSCNRVGLLLQGMRATQVVGNIVGLTAGADGVCGNAEQGIRLFNVQSSTIAGNRVAGQRRGGNSCVGHT